jgi:tetratricopeptide (TPR) repeat protein
MGRTLPEDVRGGVAQATKGMTPMGRYLTFMVLTGALLTMLWLPLTACSEKAKPRAPLTLASNAPNAAQTHTEQGLQHYQKGRYAEAKSEFQLALADAPRSGEAHYNLGLVLFALGETDEAREHFIEAANLSPGNKVIWDSPALRPYGSPEPGITKKTKEQYSTQRPTFGGVGPR